MNKFNIYTPKAGRKMSVAVFLSGSGTNFEALYKRQLELEKQNVKSAVIDLVFSNVPECQGIKKAENLRINTLSFSSKKFFKSIGKPVDDEQSRELYDREVIKLIEKKVKPDLIVLAGYRRRLSGLFYNKFKYKIINMYPGDTTKEYLIRGVPASLQAINNNEPEIKCSVYIESDKQRFGPLIAQSKPIFLDKYNESNLDELDQEIRKTAEWTTLPFVIFELISNGRISIDDNNKVYLDDVVLPGAGFQL